MKRPPRLRAHRPPRPGGTDEAALAIVETLLQNMDPVRRDVLLLHRIEKLTYAQIGERLSLSRAEVIAHLASAVAELAEGLQPQGTGKDG